MNFKYTKEKLQEAVNNSTTFADVCRFLNLKPSTGSQVHIKSRVILNKIDTSHFQHWRKGKSFPNERSNTLDYCFNGSQVSSSKLRKKLIRDGYKPNNCEKCGISEWQGEEVILELDHIDSIHTNNELSNLQILCPNCHALVTRQRKLAF